MSSGRAARRPPRDRRVTVNRAGFTISAAVLMIVALAVAGLIQARNLPLFVLSVALGTALSGVLSGFYREDHESADFGVLSTTAVILGVALWATVPLLRRLSEPGDAGDGHGSPPPADDGRQLRDAERRGTPRSAVRP